MKNTALYEFQRAVELLAKGLKDNPYILGENFTGADILLGHTLGWAMAFQVPIENEKVQEYAGRVLGRDAFTRARTKEVEAPLKEE